MSGNKGQLGLHLLLAKRQSLQRVRQERKLRLRPSPLASVSSVLPSFPSFLRSSSFFFLPPLCVSLWPSTLASTQRTCLFNQSWSLPLLHLPPPPRCLQKGVRRRAWHLHRRIPITTNLNIKRATCPWQMQPQTTNPRLLPTNRQTTLQIPPPGEQTRRSPSGGLPMSKSLAMASCTKSSQPSDVSSKCSWIVPCRRAMAAPPWMLP